MKNYVRRFLKDEEGAEIIEYAIVIAIVAVLSLAILKLKAVVEQKINDASNLVANISPGGTSGGGGNGGGGAPIPNGGGGANNGGGGNP